MESHQILELQLQEAIIAAKPQPFDFVAYTQDNTEQYGIILQKLEYGEPLSVIMPLFQKEKDGYTLLTNADNGVIQDSQIKAVFDKQKGLDSWKNVIKDNGSNATLELDAKLRNFVPNIVADNFKSKGFSLKKTFDDCIQQNQQMLSQLSSDIPLEKIFDKVVSEIVNQSLNKSYKQNKPNAEAIKKMNHIEFEKIDMKNKIVSILNSIDNDYKNEDITFVNNFRQRFESNSITTEDVTNLKNKFQQIANGLRASDVINDFVTTKKLELLDSKNLEIPLNQITNPIDNKNDLQPGNKIAVKIHDEFRYGLYNGFNSDATEITLTTPDNKKETIKLDDLVAIFKLFESQKLLELHIREKLKKESALISWDDLSFENQLQLLKGESTDLLQGIDKNNSSVLEFKIFVNVTNDKNDMSLQVQSKKYVDINLNDYEFKGAKLSEEQKQKLENNEVIVFEVFDKEGTLQFTHDMKYDRDLNDIVVSPDKGINYAANPKIGKEKGYYAKSRIENQGTSNTPKL